MTLTSCHLIERIHGGHSLESGFIALQVVDTHTATNSRPCMYKHHNNEHMPIEPKYLQKSEIPDILSDI